jgi:hypothetical protein
MMSPWKRIAGLTLFFASLFFLLPILVTRLLSRLRPVQEEAPFVIRSEDDVDDFWELSHREQQEAFQKLGPEGRRLLETWDSPRILSVDGAKQMACRRGYLFPASAEMSIRQASRLGGSLA